MCMPSSNVCPRFNSLQAVTIGQAKKTNDGKRRHQVWSVGWEAGGLSFELLSKNRSRPKEIRTIYDQIPDLLTCSWAALRINKANLMWSRYMSNDTWQSSDHPRLWRDQFVANGWSAVIRSKRGRFYSTGNSHAYKFCSTRHLGNIREIYHFTQHEGLSRIWLYHEMTTQIWLSW